jgi:GT2 family glycosyltransferase
MPDRSVPADTPKVTVGILCHDSARYLAITLASVRAQTYPSLEVLLLDNGSSDRFVESYSGADGLRVIRETTNTGYGRGKNRLVAEARGEYVLLLDDDVELPDPATVARFVDFSRRLNDRCVVSLVLGEWGSDTTVHYGLFFVPAKRRLSLAELRSLPAFRAAGPVGGCIFIRRALFEAIGGFDELYPFNLDDYDLGARGSLLGIDVWLMTSTFGVHRGADRRDDTRAWEWKYSYYLCGMLRTLGKTCRSLHALLWLPGAAAWILMRGVLQTRARGVAPTCRALIASVRRALRDAPSTTRCRRVVQARRTDRSDRFLTILPPDPCLNRFARTLVAAARMTRIIGRSRRAGYASTTSTRTA